MRLYYFTNAAHGLENIEKRRIKIARISDLNDPFEFLPLKLADTAARKGMRKIKKFADAELGIICFTKSWEHPMMWSHYADRHRGLCLGFDIVNSHPVIPVEYKPDLLRPNDLKIEHFDQLRITDVMRTWFVKYEAWQYEAERRMIFQLNKEYREGALFFHQFERSMRLAEVIVGAESDVTYEQVTTAIGGLCNIELTKARLAFTRFAIVKQHKKSMWK
ncbi:DUF2971 domain-containing protein [Ochrobactrum teleogrylli]